MYSITVGCQTSQHMQFVLCVSIYAWCLMPNDIALDIVTEMYSSIHPT